MRKAILFLIISFFSLSIIASVGEPCVREMSSLDGFVRQQTEILSASEEEGFENLLDSFRYKTSAEILLVITDDLCGYDPSNYCFELGEMVGVGQEEEDNGVDVDNSAHYIEVGYGLEEVITAEAINRLNE